MKNVIVISFNTMNMSFSNVLRHGLGGVVGVIARCGGRWTSGMHIGVT